MNLYIAMGSAFILGLSISHFAYKAYKYAKNRWNVPTFDGWKTLIEKGKRL